MPSYKYYVVWQGREPGIYDNWNECAVQVNDFPSPNYQGVNTLTDALALWAKGPQEESKSTQLQKQPTNQSLLPLTVPSVATKDAKQGPVQERKVLKKERFSSSSHTYFFEVKETTSGSNYVVIDQRRKVGEEFESSKLRIFEDELLEFNRVLQKMIHAALETK